MASLAAGACSVPQRADDTCARNVPCVGDGSPALRSTGVCRGAARASQVTGSSSACGLWSNTPPDTYPSLPISRRVVVAVDAVQHARHPGRREVAGPPSHGPHARMPMHCGPCYQDRRKAYYRLGRAHPWPGRIRTCWTTHKVSWRHRILQFPLTHRAWSHWISYPSVDHALGVWDNAGMRPPASILQSASHLREARHQ
jgi:hypothetical protein